MYDKISQMEPMMPEYSGLLEDMSKEIVSQSAALVGQIHPLSQKPLMELLRIINSYYSNLIEGHSAHPVDTERAMRQDYTSEPAKRDLQLESLAHIKTQREIDSRLSMDSDLNVADPSFIRWIHETFYQELTESLRLVKADESDEIFEVSGGDLRKSEIKVGRHIGPLAEKLPDFLNRFAMAYRSGAHHGVTPIIAIAASHHRLMWIHPFLDGNGRVTRLYTDACFRRFPLLGYGLWNVSRGLARRRDEYMAALTQGDAPRRNDYDGRGNLSNEGLVMFCRFFLGVCLDQIGYMNSLLKLDGLLARLHGYARLREEKVIPAPAGTEGTFKSEAAFMLQEALLRGEVSRGDMIRVSGLAERTGRKVLGQLLDEGLLESDMPKGAVRIAFSTCIAGYLFPDLYPTQVL